MSAYQHQYVRSTSLHPHARSLARCFLPFIDRKAAKGGKEKASFPPQSGNNRKLIGKNLLGFRRMIDDDADGVSELEGVQL